MIYLGMCHVVAGLLVMGVCIPLMQRKIGRNAWYGFRTPRTLSSDEARYAVNHGAAKAGVFMSIGTVIFGILLALLPPAMSTSASVLTGAVAAPIVLALGTVVAMCIELKKLDR